MTSADREEPSGLIAKLEETGNTVKVPIKEVMVFVLVKLKT